MAKRGANGQREAGTPASDASVSPAEQDAIQRALRCLENAKRAAQHENVPGEQRAILAVQIGTAIGILSGAIAQRMIG